MRFIRHAMAACAVTLLGAAAQATGANAITGAGSTFVNPILSKWSSDYNAINGVQLNYQSIGSGGGIAQIKAATVTFGASDKPLNPADLAAFGATQFPLVIGGVVPIVNLTGVQPGSLKFTGPVLAAIYMGKITKWNDPAILKLNPGIKLPALDISVVHRSDGSGTTFNWADFLSKVSPEWKEAVGADTAVAWPTGVGGKGNEGVAAYVGQIQGAIGYVEYAYVQQNHMNFCQVQNSSGKFITPNASSFQAAAATADWTHAQDFNLVITNAPGANAYPISATVFVIMYKKPKVPADTKTALDFFKWALEHGQPQAEALNYVPLPAPLVKQVEAAWKANIQAAP
ncbi:MAG: phosphate ABC transporter substrate-binding protein PstS [Steroidobacteraceae bacterium]